MEFFYNNLALANSNLEDYEQFLVYAEKTLKIQEVTLTPTHRDLLNSYESFISTYYNFERYGKALKLSEKLNKALAKMPVGTAKDSALVRAYLSSGLINNNLKNYAIGIADLKKGLEIAERIFDSNNEEIIMIKNNLAIAYRNLGVSLSNKEDYQNGVTNFQEALRVLESLNPLATEETDQTLDEIATCYINWAIKLSNSGAYDQAEPIYQKAMKTREKIASKNDPDLGFLYYNVGIFNGNRKEYQQAINYTEKALKIYKLTPPSANHPTITEIEETLGKYRERIK